ncbi:hypothetical protein WJX81_007380 [Elliptochloris bilobata]|uniref:Mediator of RNA polymerase II transcription subunit 21 n=1 Tax=Elliptochloris bilobata TaxID=381761 RepID=A0AAW1S5L4_9CHLO
MHGQELQPEVEKIAYILQDPRPLDAKQSELVEAAEAVAARAVEAGAASLAALLPAELAAQLPAELRRGAGSDPNAAAGSAGYAETLAPYPDAAAPAMLATNQAAAEVDSVRGAMAALRTALEALACNADASQDAVLRLNARDARTGLARRLDQLSSATVASTDPQVAAALDDSVLLMEELESLSI